MHIFEFLKIVESFQGRMTSPLSYAHLQTKTYRLEFCTNSVQFIVGICNGFS